MFVQANTCCQGNSKKGVILMDSPLFVCNCLFVDTILLSFITDDKVTMATFSSTAEGMIKSFTSRFPRDDQVLEGLWRADLPHHKY